MNNFKIRNVVFFVFFSCLFAQDPIVNLPQGRIIGTKVYNERSLIPIEIYYGIPYATPPIGRYRFSAPERNIGWKRTLYAHRPPPHCPHAGDDITSSDINNFSEDCLFLNIWTSRPADGKLLPTVVILYSESWAKGGVTLPCQDLAADDVVVVTVGYRLHLLGFFTFESVLARGNLALLDQYLAFLWIRDNISAFGGDPNAITVLGHSAGADSILYHLLSPRSQGLFQRAVIMSPTNPWKFIDDKINNISAAHLSREVASTLGCTSKVDLEILSCLRSKSLHDIMSLYSNKTLANYMQPLAETYLPESEQFIPMTLFTALSHSKQPVMQVDLLLGTTDLEAFDYNDQTFYELMKHNSSYVSDYLNNVAIPDLLKMFSLYQPETILMLTRAIRWEHWDVHNNIHESIEALARLETSAKWGAGGALLAARLARQVARLFVYRYSLPTSMDLEGRRWNLTGAIHGSDLISLLGDSIVLQVARRQADTKEKRYSSIFRRYILNFIKTGYPESEEIWRRYRPGYAQIFEVNAEDKTLLQNANKDAKFWLQYLPDLSNFYRATEQTESLTLGGDDGRLRGGVFAMVGVAIVLLLLLCTSTILLHRQRLRRQFPIGEDVSN